jgi:glutamate/tyrosine decarboxylase-like PLP-dependent enzyme
MTLETRSLTLLDRALKELEAGFSDLPEFDPEVDVAAVGKVLMETARRMRDNYPYHHPMYVGQMLKPPHPAARLAYMLSLWINPNNHALDGGRCSSAMEREAVAAIARMIGWDVHLGHICSGGTMANLEALWISRRLHPEKGVAASEQAHYTHERICSVLGIPFHSVRCCGDARIDPNALEDLLKKESIGTVVVTMGTTATGSTDSLPDILELRERYGFRIHADAAYGGYFILADNLESRTRASFDVLDRVDSIVIDPHKHGLQPYGCGCVLFKDPGVGRFYKHDSPYTYFTSDELHLGEISLQCSSPGASAVALWATQRLLPMTRGGEFARGLAKSREAALEFFRFLERDPRFACRLVPELDIVVWTIRGSSASEASRLAVNVFREAETANLHMAVADLPCSFVFDEHGTVSLDRERVSCLRVCLMKPEHLDWIDRVEQALDAAVDRVLGSTARRSTR